MIHWITSHPYVSSMVATLIAFHLVSNFVDALKLVPPKPTDGRLYVFWYTFAMSTAGNLVTALQHLLKLETHA